MQLSHLGLPVRDYQRSLRFYADYFGFDPGRPPGRGVLEPPFSLEG